MVKPRAVGAGHSGTRVGGPKLRKPAEQVSAGFCLRKKIFQIAKIFVVKPVEFFKTN